MNGKAPYKGTEVKMRRPIVAVTADTLLAEMKPINQKMADYAPRPLIDALGRNGFLPVILPYNDYAEAEELVGTFDALVLPGGPNPTPRFYHEDPIWSIGPTYEKRDKFEIDLIQACIKAGKPILGICRGLQILNVALGGTLWQDMQSQNSGAFIQHMQRAPGNIATHYIEVEKDTRLMDILGEGLYVNSRHREGIKKLAQGLRPAARTRDGVIEAVESERRRPHCRRPVASGKHGPGNHGHPLPRFHGQSPETYGHRRIKERAAAG